MASTSSDAGKKVIPGYRGEDTGEGGAVSYGANLDHLAESKELISLAMALPAVYKELRNREMSEERFTRESGLVRSIICDLHTHTCSYSGQVPGTTSLTGPLFR